MAGQYPGAGANIQHLLPGQSYAAIQDRTVKFRGINISIPGVIRCRAPPVKGFAAVYTGVLDLHRITSCLKYNINAVAVARVRRFCNRFGSVAKSNSNL